MERSDQKVCIAASPLERLGYILEHICYWKNVI